MVFSIKSSHQLFARTLSCLIHTNQGRVNDNNIAYRICFLLNETDDFFIGSQVICIH